MQGSQKCIVKKMIDFTDYRQCMFPGRNVSQKQPLFWNKLHEIYTIEVNMLASSRDDNKQVTKSDGVHTLAYKHKEDTDVFRT